MSNHILVTDTHPLIWYISKQDSKLPKKVFAAFKSAQEGGGSYIWVPTTVVWEISLLIKRTKRFATLGRLEDLVAANFFSKNISVTDTQAADVMQAHSLNFNNDPFDALIVGTAMRMSLPLITADDDITKACPCEIFWD